ncbi:hypothetical protein H6G04_30085 [Calothrix membranacea FACHB-236]|nr:hypothetical protein [Calothrix membranacea FACHB-236]
MGDGRTEKVTFTCTPEMKDFLVNWASEERRSISNLVEGLVAEAITQRKVQTENQISPPKNQKS